MYFNFECPQYNYLVPKLWGFCVMMKTKPPKLGSGILSRNVYRLCLVGDDVLNEKD